MLRVYFDLMQIINTIVFLISFSIILRKLYNIDNELNTFQKMAGLSIILSVIIFKIKFYYMSIEYLFASIILLILICKCIYKFSWKKSIINSSIYSSIYMVMNSTVYFILLYIYIFLINKYKLKATLRIDVIEFIVFNLSVFIFVYNFDKLKKIYEGYKYYIYIVLTIIINGVIIMFLYMATSGIYDLYDKLTKNKIYYDSSILNMPFVNFADRALPYIVVGINIVFISLLINSIKSAKEESKVKLMNDKLDLQYNYYLTVQESQDRVKKLYHDINNHIISISAIQNNSDDVNKYIEDIDKEIRDFNSIYNTSNMLLDTILNEKNRICKENNIEFICDINFSKCSFIEMIDITSIFSNLLDNSIEACNKIDNKEINKYIKIRGTTVKKYYVIRCENSKVNKVLEKNNKFLTSKRDKFVHGIGIESIKSSLKKYGGELEIKTEKNKFIAIIYIPIE